MFGMFGTNLTQLGGLNPQLQSALGQMQRQIGQLANPQPHVSMFEQKDRGPFYSAPSGFQTYAAGQPNRLMDPHPQQIAPPQQQVAPMPQHQQGYNTGIVPPSMSQRPTGLFGIRPGV